MARISAAPIMPRVAGVSGTCSETTSAVPRSSGRLAQGSACPSGSFAVWSWKITRMPKASASTLSWAPILP
jgi:hypothetical protein